MKAVVLHEYGPGMDSNSYERVGSPWQLHGLTETQRHAVGDVR